MGSYNRPSRPSGPKDPAHQLTNLSRMLEQLGIDPDKVARFLGTTDLAAAVRACELCPATEVCQDWQARGSASVQQLMGFCPNAPQFSQLAEIKRYHSFHDGNPSGRLH